jgi:predicted TIM-barrel fold metal-dependent hydrolase
MQARTPGEPPIDPARPIIDPHLHFWDIRPAPGLPQEPQRFLLHEAAALLDACGHDVTHTVFVECRQMYRADGPAELASLGETEFAAGIAAMSASGGYGPRRLGHRIVGNADLRLGDRLRPVLEAHLAAAGGRFRGIRMHTAFSGEGLFGFPPDPAWQGVLRDPAFVAGARVLAAMDLSLDLWCVHSQLADVAALADAVPDLAIVLDHLGTPVLHGRLAGQEAAVRREWAGRIAELARRPNLRVKLGGLGMPLDRPIGAATGAASSADLAASWRPWIETGIAAFTPERAMFESNFPPDQAAAPYGTVWNAFKRIAAGCSEDEQDRLFRRTAAATYRIELP